jgi:tRNA pseudouridine38-40 synthase
MRLRIDIAYDGAPFHGFALQPDLRTVQGTLEAALGRLLGQEVATTAAGRTDRGVHASAQVVHLDIDPGIARAQRTLDVDTGFDDFRRRLDHLVGDAIAVWAVRRVSSDFDARFSAVARRYLYRLSDGDTIHPLERFATWHLGEPLRLSAMRAGARHLLGEHDFASFCRSSGARTTVRRIDRIVVSRPVGGTVHVRLRAPAFCHQQVRSIVGCLVEVGVGRRAPEWMAEVLAARHRGAAGPVAPPHGLLLERVSYGRGYPASPPGSAGSSAGSSAAR